MHKEIPDDLNMICNILHNSKNIAVVGISNNPMRTSRQIADFLVDAGFNVVGINPGIKSAGNIICYPSLKEVPFEIDIVDVFRRSENIPELIPDVLEVKPKTLWLQQGIRNDEAVKPVIEAGINTLQDKCIAVYFSLCRSYK